jgi:DNA-binding transcriptional ArsR family regulator
MIAPSLCGINCYLCEQYLGKRCKICANEEGKKDCETLKCVLEIENVKSCFECHKIAYCKKRGRSIDACLVFRTRRELAPGVTYVLTGPWKDGMATFAKHVFMGKDGLIFTNKDPSAITREFMLEGTKIYRLAGDKSGKDKIHPKDLGAIKEVFTGEINEKDIIILDGLDSLIEANSFQKTVDLISWIDKKILSSPATLLITTENLTGEQESEIRGVVTGSKTKKIIRSISNPKRMEILDHLRMTGKSMFTEIYESLGYCVPPKLSFHLKVLRDSGVIEQDAEGIYYISNLGEEIGGVLDKIGEMIEKGEAASLAHAEVGYSETWNEKYEWYVRRMSRETPDSVSIISDVKSSLQIIFGRKKTEEIFQTILMDYIETEKRMNADDLKRMISEIAFVFLVDSIQLAEAVEWADELLKKHGLKQWKNKK